MTVCYTQYAVKEETQNKMKEWGDSMKKIISYILIAAIFALPLSGCGADETESADTANMEQTQASGGLNGQEGSADPESILDA